uniref:Uncharacterized protein n=1 Tax=Serratia proteamaculans (strain 568) TaxID=399741 RepID=A8GIN8_SERP5
MSNVILFQKVKEVTEQPGEYYAEAIHDGVKIYQKYSDNRYHEQEVIPFADVLIRADDGEWDDNRSLALRLLAEWGGIPENHSPHNLVVLYRWLVADAYIADLVAINGIEEFHGQNGGMVTNRKIERLAIANNIEGTGIERYGIEEGAKLIVKFYQQMLEISNGNIVGISAFGRDTLNELHEGFLQAYITEGLPNETHH